MSTLQQDSTAPGASTEADPAHLDLVPVDPHRLFAHWRLPARELARLRDMAGDHAADHHLTLRVFRLPDGTTSLRDAVDTADFPVGASDSDGYFSLAQPGGNVVGVLGVKNAKGRFTPAVTSARVALPEAPRSPAREEPREAATEPAPVEPPAPAAEPDPEFARKSEAPEKPPAVLDEAAVIAAAGWMEQLPEQLRTVPAAVAPKEDDPASGEPSALPPVDAAAPETPTLDERSVVTSALRQMLTEAVEPERSAKHSDPARSVINGATKPAPSSAESVSSYRLASQMGEGASGAPVRIRATLAVTGRLAPGQKLRVGDKQITATPGGSIAFRHQLDAADAIWPLLLHVVLHQPARSTPSLELLSELPDSEALLSLHANVDIEGEIHDPAYRSRLPDGIKVDAAGRFRIVRPLPAGALLLPHLVLVAGGD